MLEELLMRKKFRIRVGRCVLVGSLDAALCFLEGSERPWKFRFSDATGACDEVNSCVVAARQRTTPNDGREEYGNNAGQPAWAQII